MVDGSNRPQAENVDNEVTRNVPGERPASTAVLAESVLDRRYRLLAPLNTRGPVTLWRGDDNVLARPVAVRIVEHFDEDGGSDDATAAEKAVRQKAAQALLRAAINSGRLVHPGAASTYDATTTTAESLRVSYVVSEWVEGRTLRQLAAEGPLRPEQAGAIVLAAARVLAAAHDRGIHHGGLNPGDVIVSGHGTVKVVDLEIGGVLAGLDGAATGAEPTIGADGDAAQETPSPELSDVRALGGLLYAGLTGAWPLLGEHALPAAPTTDGRLRTPRQINAAVPRDLDAITLATLGDDRAGAPITTAAELVAELEAVSPVDQVLDTGLMSLGDDGPLDTEAMPVDGFDASTSDYPAPADYPDRNGYGGRDYGRGSYSDRADPPGYGGRAGPDRTAYLGPGGYDQTSYDERGYGGADDRGYGGRDRYDDRTGGYPPAQRGPREPRGYDNDRYPPPGGHRRAGGGPAGGSTARKVLPWVALLVVIALVAVVAVIALRPDDGGGSGEETGPSATALVPSGDRIAFGQVTSFDPLTDDTDKTENDDTVPLATDENPETQWTTGRYETAQFGGLKPGLGLRFAFPQPIKPSEVVVTVGALGPLSFELRAADSLSGNPDDYKIVGARQQAKSGAVQIGMPSDQPAHQYWVLWITELPEESKKGSIAEIEFRN